jgi:hypothetical protein
MIIIKAIDARIIRILKSTDSDITWTQVAIRIKGGSIPMLGLDALTNPGTTSPVTCDGYPTTQKRMPPLLPSDVRTHLSPPITMNIRETLSIELTLIIVILGSLLIERILRAHYCLLREDCS